jgi:hypothetical protein
MILSDRNKEDLEVQAIVCMSEGGSEKEDINNEDYCGIIVYGEDLREVPVELNCLYQGPTKTFRDEEGNVEFIKYRCNAGGDELKDIEPLTTRGGDVSYNNVAGD